MKAIGFIGAGAVGSALALALHAKGYRVVAVTSKTTASAHKLASLILGCKAMDSASRVAETCDVVFITTPDRAITGVAKETAWRTGQGVVHCSGLHGIEILEEISQGSVQRGAFHPFQTFPYRVSDSAGALEMLTGVTFAVEGEGWLEEFLEGITRLLGGKVVHVPYEGRALYYLSAVMSAGYLVALLNAASSLWPKFGLSKEDGAWAVLRLAGTTVQNADPLDMAKNLTGPIIRGDVSTVRLHLRELEISAPRLVPLYCWLGLETLSFANNRIGAEESRQLEEIFTPRWGLGAEKR